MKENKEVADTNVGDIEEAIERLEYIDRTYSCNNYYSIWDLKCIEIILSDYKRTLKENEELRKELNEENKRCMMLAIEKQDYFEKYRYHLQQNERLTKEFSNVILVQKVKDKIEELEEEIKPKQDIHQKLCIEVNKIGTETEYDYAMEELSILDDELREMLIKKRVLQDLLERSREDEFKRFN